MAEPMSEDGLTDVVLARLEATPDPRLREIVQAHGGEVAAPQATTIQTNHIAVELKP